MSGPASVRGSFAFKATFDAIRDRFWWPTMSTNVRNHIEACLSCQHRKSSHHPPKLPVGHRFVTHAFQCVAVDRVEYKRLSQGNRFILSVIDHLTRFVVLIPMKDKAARTFVIWSNACSRCLALQKHFIPTKARNLRMNWSRNFSQFFYIRKRVQPPFALRVTLF